MIGPPGKMVAKARLDMNCAPNSGALKAEALLSGSRLLVVTAIQGEATCDTIELVEVGRLIERVGHGSEADNWPTAPAEASAHDVNAERDGTRKYIGNLWTLGKAEVEESCEWKDDDHSVGKTASGKSHLENLAGFPC